ncbi:BatA domain-containing protein [Aquimarina brevivitae]|uniref:Putative membrane protein (TIGR02226 family) n=1 Tax=Aquimarina brevivitae TaxID=323412 RepID=A0A4Q7NTT7_9FLAO|nr:BatA domain-containing protein [Aquimarina brevivitae]RZS90603.1 putative membrane protein (TIGR02226 family) [Aquimarina brevivitae]
MQFLFPTYLWGLLGLAVPIIIHLWSKKEGKVIKIGSIQNLQASETKRASSIQLNELLLLLLRLLIVGLIVLAIAQPVIQGNKERLTLTYIIEPSLLNDQGVNNIITAAESNYDVRLLQPDLPRYDSSVDVAVLDVHPPDYWQVVPKLNQLPTDSIIVLSKGLVTGIKGKRPELSKKINWIKIDPKKASSSETFAVMQQEEEFVAWKAILRNHNLQFQKSKLQKKELKEFGKDSLQLNNKALPLLKRDKLIVNIHASDSLQSQVKFIKASLKAIATYTSSIIDISNINKESDAISNCDLLIWLDQTAAPAMDSIPVLIFKPDPLANLIIEASHQPNRYYLTAALTKENSIDKNFATQIATLLHPYEAIEPLVSNMDQRSLDQEQFKPESKHRKLNKNYQMIDTLSLSSWFWLAIVVIFMVERILAMYKKQ